MPGWQSYTNSALYPFVEQLALAARIESNDDPARKLAKLEELLALSRRPTATAVPLFAPLLSIPLGDAYVPVTSGYDWSRPNRDALVCFTPDLAPPDDSVRRSFRIFRSSALNFPPPGYAQTDTALLPVVRPR